MPKQVLLLQKNPARPEVMPLANGNNVFTMAFLMGQFLPTPPSQGDYISSMRTFNKHTEPPFCNFLQWILPCDSHMPPILSTPILSAPTCHIYQQTLHLSCLPFTPCPSPISNFTAYILPWACWYTPACLPMTIPASYFYVLPPPFLIIFFCLLLLFLPLSVNHVFPKVPPSPHCDR